MYVVVLSPVIFLYRCLCIFHWLFFIFPNLYWALASNLISSWPQPCVEARQDISEQQEEHLTLCAKALKLYMQDSWNNIVSPCDLCAVQKPGKWCAMHVYVAWMILSHQKKVKVRVSYWNHVQIVKYSLSGRREVQIESVVTPLNAGLTVLPISSSWCTLILTSWTSVVTCWPVFLELGDWAPWGP